MDDALHHFHTIKDVFLLGQASKKAKAKANALTAELVKKRKVDDETNDESWCAIQEVARNECLVRRENLRCNRNRHILSLLPLCDGCFL
jgi:hypothetical protein